MLTTVTKYICTFLDQTASEHDVRQDKKHTAGVSNEVQINIRVNFTLPGRPSSALRH